jgi:anti-sigma factor RsiW
MSERCQTTLTSLSAYVDGELPPHEAAAVAEHLATCFPCSAEYETMLETVSSLRDQLERFTAPDVLRARIRTAIASTASGDAGDRAAVQIAQPRRGARWTRIGSWAAAILLAAALGSSATLIATRGHDRGDTSIASQVLASHVRSLMPDHLTDVRSNDTHNVKPWFNGRLDFSPTVPRLEDQGYPLLGGRLDYVNGRPVAVVVYGRRQHVINVFSWPSAGPDVAREMTAKNGYTMIHWRSEGTEHWVLSDVNSAELQSFAGLLQAK